MSLRLQVDFVGVWFWLDLRKWSGDRGWLCVRMREFCAAINDSYEGAGASYERMMSVMRCVSCLCAILQRFAYSKAVYAPVNRLRMLWTRYL